MRNKSFFILVITFFFTVPLFFSPPPAYANLIALYRPRSPMEGYFIALVITFSLKLSVALAFLIAGKITKHILIFVVIAHLISLAIDWSVLSVSINTNSLHNSQSFLSLLAALESITVVFETTFIYFPNRSLITFRRALLLSLIMNIVSLFLGFFAWIWYANDISRMVIPYIPQTKDVIQTQILPNSTPKAMPLPTEKAGFLQYSEKTLRYGFSYPDSLKLSECRDIPCLSIEKANIFLQIEPLDSVYLTNNPKTSLLTTDLYCDANGPGGGVDCQNTKVEDYINPLGFKGFKVYRTKTVTGKGAGIYKDLAYVYYFPKPQKLGNLTWIGVLFATDSTNASLFANQSQLNEIADSYFTF